MARETIAVSKTRGEAIMRAIEEIEADLLPGDEADLIVCAGDEACPYSDEAARDAAQAGCPMCTRMTIGEEWRRA